MGNFAEEKGFFFHNPTHTSYLASDLDPPMILWVDGRDLPSSPLYKFIRKGKRVKEGKKIMLMKNALAIFPSTSSPLFSQRLDYNTRVSSSLVTLQKRE